MPDFELNDFLPYRLAVTASRISRAYERRYMSEAGLTVAEWRVLAHLSQWGEVSNREIEAMVDMEKSKVSRAASRLEAQGYVTKMTNPQDRRLLSLSLTAEGRALMERLIPIANAFQAELMTQLGDEAEQFKEQLGLLMEASEP